MLRLHADKLDEYKRLHEAVWPEVLQIIKEAKIRNYSIYLRRLPDGEHYLFSYFEYVGTDFTGDMDRLASNPVTRNGGPFASPARLHFQIAPPANGGTSWKKSSPGGTVLPANMPDWPALRSAIEETTSTWDDANPTITLPPHFISVIFLTRCS